MNLPRIRSSIRSAALIAAGLIVLSTLVPVGPASASAGPYLFQSPGVFDFTAPYGAVTVSADIYGAAGQDVGFRNGGRGGRSDIAVPVAPGQTLKVHVGASGSNGGVLGGGTGAGRGGGESDVRSAGDTIADRLGVAGGGGGASAIFDGGDGNGHFGSSGNGANYGGYGGNNAPAPGGQTAYPGATPATAGVFVNGGTGAAANGAVVGGGGGGGYWGGGGGGVTAAGLGGGGGGGGGLCQNGLVCNSGLRAGNGAVEFSAIISGPAPDGTVNLHYSYQIQTTGFENAHLEPARGQYDISQGSLPTGLQLNGGTGVIAGYPLRDGTWTFVVEAVSLHHLARQQLTIVVAPASPTGPTTPTTICLPASGASTAASAAGTTSAAGPHAAGTATTAPTTAAQVLAASGPYLFQSPGVYHFVAPANAVAVTADVYGASGTGIGFRNGGRGGRADVALDVTPGASLNVHVGASGDHGGVPGGAVGAGHGGGSSDIRRGGDAVSNRVAVAGGGGGSTAAFDGGDGNGHNGSSGGGESYGGFGGATAPTPPGVTALAGATPGTAGSLQNGGVGASKGSTYYGGGGGGGYFGGAGGGVAVDGTGGGGGGGSGLCVNALVCDTGVKLGDGAVEFSAIISPAPLEGVVGSSYLHKIQTIGFENAHIDPSRALYDVIAGNLPPGLQMNGATGTVTGTPQLDGKWTVVISAYSSSKYAAQQDTFTILPQGSVPPVTTPTTGPGPCTNPPPTPSTLPTQTTIPAVPTNAPGTPGHPSNPLAFTGILALWVLGIAGIALVVGLILASPRRRSQRPPPPPPGYGAPPAPSG